MNRKPKTQKEKILKAVDTVKSGEVVIFQCDADLDSARMPKNKHLMPGTLSDTSKTTIQKSSKF